MSEPQLTDREFRALLDLYMVNDPYPLKGKNEATVLNLIEQESDKRGYNSWVKAYHAFEVEQ